jgi:FAD/FMN-containing dehydrogenase
MAVGRNLVGKRPSAGSSDFPLLKTLKRAVLASQLRDHSLLIDLGQLTRVISIDAKARTTTVHPAIGGHELNAAPAKSGFAFPVGT